MARSKRTTIEAHNIIIFLLCFSSALGKCATSFDCSYNGKCEDGRCNCSAAWKGEFCETLQVVAGSRTLGYQGFQGSRLSSWGGAPLLADDGTYHLIVSEMVNHAGLTPWGCNSQIVEATSADPISQPFKRKRTLWHTFSHEPRCTRVPSGIMEYVCFFSHNPHYPSAPCQGSNGSSMAQCACNNGGRKPTYMSFTDNLKKGSWSDPVLVLDSDVDLNLSPYIHSNGSLHALFRNNQGSNVHIATAANWRDPTTYEMHLGDLSGGMFLPEDPFLYRDAYGKFHSLHHNYPWPNGPHAFSDDGWVWHKAPNEKGSRGLAYGPVVNFTDDARVLSAGCRERPSLIFGQDGVTPIALVNGFSPNPSHVGDTPSGSCRYNGVDYSYTFVQPLQTSAGAN